MAGWRSRIPSTLGAIAGVLVASVLVLRSTGATFSSTTSTGSNGWSTSGVVISDDSGSSAIFSSSGDGTLTGGQRVDHCVVVTFHGTTTAGVQVRLYGTASGSLTSALSLVIDQGTGGGSGSCTGFSTTTAGIYSGTVAGLAASATDYASGVGTWSPTSVGATMTYRFAVTVQNTAAAQNSTGSAAFTWEAQG
jgi:hypothetical protein